MIHGRKPSFSMEDWPRLAKDHEQCHWSKLGPFFVRLPGWFPCATVNLYQNKGAILVNASLPVKKSGPE